MCVCVRLCVCVCAVVVVVCMFPYFTGGMVGCFDVVLFSAAARTHVDWYHFLTSVLKCMFLCVSSGTNTARIGQ